jgi:hypothetical protein
MKTMSVTEFKKRFSEVLSTIKDGETIAVTYGKKKEIIGYFVHQMPERPKIKLGLLEGKAKVTFAPDFKMTEDEFLGIEE